MAINAYKRNYEFCRSHNVASYSRFLVSHLSELNPTFYSVVAHTKIQTRDGIMYVVKMRKDIENPQLEPIAECIINNENIYLWHDTCWGVAVGKDNQTLDFKKRIGLGELAYDPDLKLLVLYELGKPDDH